MNVEMFSAMLVTYNIPQDIVEIVSTRFNAEVYICLLSISSKFTNKALANLKRVKSMLQFVHS